MIRSILPAAVIIAASAIPAHAQSIAGNWITQSDETARIAICGAAYCITLRTGKHKGGRIGRMAGKGNSYSGSITDPNNNKTYSGKAIVNGRTMSMSGCVFAGLFCRSQTWRRR